MHLSKWKAITVGMSAVALCISSTGAIATTAFRPVSINPLVALSALGSSASRAALCGSTAAAAAGTAVAGQGMPGCLLPIGDAVPPPPVETAPPPVAEVAPVAATTGLYAIPPVLLGMVGIVLGLVLLKALDDDEQGDEDNSPA